MRAEKESNFFEQALIEQQLRTFLDKAMERYEEEGQLLNEEELAWFFSFHYSFTLNWGHRLLLLKSKIALSGAGVRRLVRLRPLHWGRRLSFLKKKIVFLWAGVRPIIRPAAYGLVVTAALLAAGWLGGPWLLRQFDDWKRRPVALTTPAEKLNPAPLSPREIHPRVQAASVSETPPVPPVEKAVSVIPVPPAEPAAAGEAVPHPEPAAADAPADRQDLGSGFYAVRANGKWGLLNPNGKIVLEARFDRIQRFQNSDAFFRVEAQGKTGVANTAGEMVIFPFFDAIPAYFSNADLFVVTKEGRQSVYDRRRQRFVPGLEFAEISCFSEGRFCVRLDNGRWTFVDALGRPVVADTYDAILQPFRQGRAHVRLNGQDIFIDLAGEEVAVVE